MTAAEAIKRAEIGFDTVSECSLTANKLARALQVAREKLEDSEVRWRFLAGHRPCIGASVLHVDGNCTHCSAKYFSTKTNEALAEIDKIFEETK